MSATPSDHIAPALEEHPGAARAGAAERGVAHRSIWTQQLLIISVFWVYVAISNILYANSMQASILTETTVRLYARWDARLLQHVFLYPALVGAVWLSLRIGWQSWWRSLPLQLICAVLFAVLGAPLMWLGEYLTSGPELVKHSMGMHPDKGVDLSGWAASATSFLLTYGFALALITGFAFYRRLRDTEVRAAALERALAASQLATLRLQLSPHTLFNLLHTIRGQISWDPAAAQSMIVQLGELLRRLLAAGEREFTRLPSEVQFVRLYLELQQKRFADRLSVSVPDGVALPAVWVPSLIMQPLVENAVVHGLAGHDGPVAIRVEVLTESEHLVLRVVNTIAAGRASGTPGIGLTNVRERLAIQFGERASFSAAPADGNVWIAQARIPLLRDGPR